MNTGGQIKWVYPAAGEPTHSARQRQEKASRKRKWSDRATTMFKSWNAEATAPEPPRYTAFHHPEGDWSHTHIKVMLSCTIENALAEAGIDWDTVRYHQATADTYNQVEGIVRDAVDAFITDPKGAPPPVALSVVDTVPTAAVASRNTSSSSSSPTSKSTTTSVNVSLAPVAEAGKGASAATTTVSVAKLIEYPELRRALEMLLYHGLYLVVRGTPTGPRIVDTFKAYQASIVLQPGWTIDAFVWKRKAAGKRGIVPAGCVSTHEQELGFLSAYRRAVRPSIVKDASAKIVVQPDAKMRVVEKKAEIEEANKESTWNGVMSHQPHMAPAPSSSAVAASELGITEEEVNKRLLFQHDVSQLGIDASAIPTPMELTHIRSNIVYDQTLQARENLLLARISILHGQYDGVHMNDLLSGRGRSGGGSGGTGSTSSTGNGDHASMLRYEAAVARREIQDRLSRYVLLLLPFLEEAISWDLESESESEAESDDADDEERKRKRAAEREEAPNRPFGYGSEKAARGVVGPSLFMTH